MANNSRINPMYVDTASSSRLVSDSTELMINGIIPIPSNSTWAVILKDGAGNIIFSVNNTGAGHGFYPSVPIKVTGLVVDTLTNATVLIYTNP